jgi:flagellar biosynthesis chaperone FliJ
MKTEIISSQYEGGLRVVLQRVSYTKEDDQNELSSLEGKRAALMARASGVSEAAKKLYQGKIDDLDAKIAKQSEIVEGYSK